MSINHPSSFEILPVRVFHRILDNLDAETICFSIRSVCRLFRTIVNNYDRYNFDFKFISKCNFQILCQLISPHNLISLTLYNNETIPDQISLFISTIRLRQLTQLHSINLFGIEEFQLDIILKSINRNCLISFSLHIQNYDNRRKKTTENYLSAVMSQSTLRKIELNIKNDRISNIKWPSNCRIKSLIFNEGINYNNLSTIFSCSPQLHTLIIKQNLSTVINHFVLRSSFPQLTSLTIEKLDVNLDQLQSFLSSTPSLIYLKLISENCLFNGKRWEEFIQINLPHLDKFEFFITSQTLNNQTHEDLQLINKSFQTPFWIEYKKWFVICEYDLIQSRQIQIYSIPICKSKFRYNVDSEKIFLSTTNDISMKNNINELILPLNMPININMLKQSNISFRNVTKISIDFDLQLPINIIEYLPSIINISQLIEVKLESHYFGKENKNILFNMIKRLEQSKKLLSLIIHSRYCKCELYPFLNDICSILPKQINYLQIPINQLEQIEIILERCQYLSVIQFETTRIKISAEVIEWFKEKTIDSTFRRQNGCDYIWIGKKINQININHKRIKLMEN